MFEYSHSSIDYTAVHRVGNPSNGDELILSEALLDTSDKKLEELLMRFFLAPFSNPEYYSFTFSNDDYKLNPLFHFAAQAFDRPIEFHEQSVNIAKLLYDCSKHPHIKVGDLFVVYFSGITLEGNFTDAIGIFKSENKQAFLKVEEASRDFSLHYEDGINIDKLDKGCLIFNAERDSGFKVCIVDKSNKNHEALFWKEDFLHLKNCNDDYHRTKEFLNIAKSFVSQQMSEEYDVSKTDQIDLLNRSVDYFKKNEAFNKEEFEEEVFKDKNLIKSFQTFDEQYREKHELEAADSFEISVQAVKKQARIFKSVLKLDKNFHVYIHGNRDLIEQGTDESGRKFYKIYYNEES
jgi:hypothetical protein